MTRIDSTYHTVHISGIANFVKCFVSIVTGGCTVVLNFHSAARQTLLVSFFELQRSLLNLISSGQNMILAGEDSTQNVQSPFLTP